MGKSMCICIISYSLAKEGNKFTLSFPCQLNTLKVTALLSASFKGAACWCVCGQVCMSCFMLFQE